MQENLYTILLGLLSLSFGILVLKRDKEKKIDYSISPPSIKIVLASIGLGLILIIFSIFNILEI